MAAVLRGRPGHFSITAPPPGAPGADASRRFEHDALSAEPGSLLASLATLQLILDDELTPAFALCEALIDVARPRGWLIALAHGCMFRAMALVRVGEIRDAEADGRLAFEYKPAPYHRRR